MTHPVCSKIIQARRFGVTHCGILTEGDQTPAEALVHSGLSDTCRCAEINRDSAYEIVVHILHVDLAYQSEIMPVSAARALATEFFEMFTESGTRFFTNLMGYAAGSGSEQAYVHTTMDSCLNAKAWPKGASWNPATNATFDLGVILLGNMRSGILWVEDED
jgi:hypothetical protein